MKLRNHRCDHKWRYDARVSDNDALLPRWPGHNEPEQKVPQNKGNVDASEYIFHFFDNVQ